jgi:hypothetical protein
MRERVFYADFRAHGLGAKIHDAILYRAALRTPHLRDVPWVRARRRPSPPGLTKVPLVRWDEKTRYLLNTHRISPRIVAPVTGVLLHFKFLHDLHGRAIQEVARGEHYDGAAEYRRYAETLSLDPDMTLMYEGSTRFEGSGQLVQLGLMEDTSGWIDARRGGIE